MLFLLLSLITAAAVTFSVVAAGDIFFFVNVAAAVLVSLSLFLKTNIFFAFYGFTPQSGVVFVGLRRALDLFVHFALRLSEDEPYGVRGANIMLRFKAKEEEDDAYLGSIAVDPNTVGG